MHVGIYIYTYNNAVIDSSFKPCWEIRMQAEITTRPTAPLDVAPGSSEAILYWNRSLARRSLFLVWGIDVVYT
jgi:hypothetical protein